MGCLLSERNTHVRGHRRHLDTAQYRFSLQFTTLAATAAAASRSLLHKSNSLGKALSFLSLASERARRGEIARSDLTFLGYREFPLLRPVRPLHTCNSPLYSPPINRAMSGGRNALSGFETKSLMETFAHVTVNKPLGGSTHAA